MMLLEGLAILAFVAGPLVVFVILLRRYRRQRHSALARDRQHWTRRGG